MKKLVLVSFILIANIQSYSQIVFEKGYFIDNSNQKHECLIKNADWQNNPQSFEYRLSENSETQTATIESVREFGFYNDSKYYRDSVDIDRSSENLGRLSETRNPVFEKEVLFLKLIVEGKANLYEYVDGNLVRYFYNIENGPIEQLIYKSYRTNGNEIIKNVTFRQQLWNNLKCPSFKLREIEKIGYGKKELTSFFIEYSACNDNKANSFEKKGKKDLFHLSIRPRLNNSSLQIEASAPGFTDTEVRNKRGFGIGVEGEFILPFNRNKWGILFEPTYQVFKEQTSRFSEVVYLNVLNTRIEYNSIELPIGVRHYFFLNNESKLFLNASYVAYFSVNSIVEFTRADDSKIASLDISSASNFALGGGYKFKNKFSAEIRYSTKRDILSDYMSYNSKYNTVSIIFGYTVF